MQYLDQTHKFKVLVLEHLSVFPHRLFVTLSEWVPGWDRYHDHDQALKAYGTISLTVIRHLKYLIHKDNSQSGS